MKTIRSGRGLGDSLYLQSVVRYLLATQPLRLRVRSDYPDVFSQLGPRVEVVPFERKGDIVAHYAVRKGIDGTTQFQDCCIAAGIQESVEMRLDWTTTDPDLVQRLRAGGQPLLLVQLPRAPMGRTDGFGASLLPDCRAIQRIIDVARDTHTVVQVGAGRPLFRFTGIDIDLANETTVAQLIDVAQAADRLLGYCSFFVPLAESFDKPALFVWSRRGLNDGHVYVRRITPAKVLHKATSKAVMDTADEAELVRAWNVL